MEFQLGSGTLMVLSYDEILELKKSQTLHPSIYQQLMDAKSGFIQVETTPEGDMGELNVDGIQLIFFLNRQVLVLLEQEVKRYGVKDSHLRWNALMDEITQNATELNPIRLFLRILDCSIRDDRKRLQQIEIECYSMEESILVKRKMEEKSKHRWVRKGKRSEENCNPYGKVTHFRRELLMKSFYYTQLEDLVDTLAEDAYGIFEEGEKAAFQGIGNKMARLTEQTKLLREYLIQLREMHQQELDMKQNKTMQFLTATTTIFFPLSLIAAWYGMNFKYMPEIDGRYSYYILIGICVCLVAGEVWFFYKKKYF